LSIVFQATLLSRYIKRVFPQEESLKEELNVRLSRAVTAIGEVEKLRLDGKISEEEFTRQLESDKDELEDVLAQMDARLHPTKILRSRTSELYSSVSESIRKTGRLPSSKRNLQDQTSNETEKDLKQDEKEGNENR